MFFRKRNGQDHSPSRFKTALSRIHLVDKCLILFMIVCLTQSVYTLFFPGGSGSEIGNIDIIVRTSAAAIFGYFLSANFICHHPSPPKSPPPSGENIDQSLSLPAATTPQNKVGFDGFSTESEPQTKGIATVSVSQDPPPKVAVASKLQIVTATSIGLFCLITLLVLRNIAQLSPILADSSMAATVTQFRDFVSGCVGFLIGSPTNNGSK